MNSENMRQSSGDEVEFSQPPPAENRRLLEHLLQETVSITASDDFVPIIVQFAAKHPRGTMDVPMTTELIRELLSRKHSNVTFSDDCYRWVAQTLLNDDLSRERMANLWALALRACDDVE